MKKRVSVVFCLVLNIVIAASASEVKWTGGGADELWTTGANWEGGTVPGTYDAVVLNPPPQRGPAINSDIECGEMRGPVWKSSYPQVVDVIGCNVTINGWWRWANRGRGLATINIERANVDVKGMFRLSDSGKTYGVANIVDSTVRCKGVLIGDGGNGEINMRGNVLFEVEETVNMGGSPGDNPRSYEDKPLRISMNGGIFRIGGRLMCPSDKDRAGTASIKLTAGRLECKEFSHADVAYSMDIEEGVFIIAGDVTADIKKDIESGYITAFGGKDRVRCRYISRSDRTIVTASGRKKARRPSPRNRAENVKPDRKLTWRARGTGKRYSLYLGTSLDAVGAAAKPIAEGLSQNTFEAKLGFDQSYHWRVDTVDDAGTVHKGVTWQFSTTDGKASAPSPGVKAQKVAADARLNWKPGLVATSHTVYFGTDAGKLAEEGTISNSNFKPGKLELGKTYYWRVDAINDMWEQSPWKGEVWNFTVDSGQAFNPEPVNKAQWMPVQVKLGWEAARTATAHTVYISEKLDDVKNGTKPISKAQRETTYSVSSLKEATTYYWRVDEIGDGKVVKGDIWEFSTQGILDLKVDLAVPQWYDRSKARPGTAKRGWVIWSSARWADMYMHDGAWLPAGKGTDKDGILGSGVQLYLDNGKGGNGAVMAKGLCRGGLAGDLPVYGEPEGDAIANTYFYSCDWAGQKNGDAFLLIRGLPAGEYEMTSYHNHWEPCTQQTRNCHLCESGMPPMPSVTANPVPAAPLPGYGSWALPKGTGKGVVALENAKDIKVSSVLSDDEVSRSHIRFATDGSDVLVIYEAADNTYPDRARSGREGSRGIVNAFELKLVSWSNKGE
ncbi:MAG: hypothetical protein ACYTEX_21415 [Planctomycetota bacterium]|jgi:hypothetical protein